ncbi:hypothetical protein [Fructilactobacillus cliffordii]|uniref:Uncharacterized protein n=1 Tax=Fructilactobacillus cliffordii TaxID=2940299 RepID=A0A9Q8ZUV0_9LACO|nr:hypothetical protein [Fructilactobacillus cliffordii]USS88931.1 hypothetical protein M3M40_05440 [Fructilactobacillus cliffordii]
MEYSKFKYFLFLLNLFLNNKLFIALVTIVVVLGLLAFFIYDYRANGPVLNEHHSPNHRFRHSRKSIFETHSWVKSLFLIIPAFLLLSLFVFKNSLTNIDAPDVVVPNSKPELVATGIVNRINPRTHQAEIFVIKRGNTYPVIAEVDSRTVTPYDQVIYKYEGLHIDKKDFNRLHPNDVVEIKTNKLEFKYKNHAEFKDDKHLAEKVDLFNKSDVNGVVHKIPNPAKPD